MDPSVASAEARQRWRVVFRREPMPVGDPAESIARWAATLADSGLPLAGPGTPGVRQAVALGATLPGGWTGERELLDIVLRTRLPIEAVRRAIAGTIPAGHALVDLYDVWLGEPALAGRIRGADYRITLAADGPPADRLARACAALLAADSLPRERAKGESRIGYDLRPLLDDVGVRDPGPPAIVSCRVRFDPSRGVGRPEEVVAVLGAACARPDLRPAATVRERLLLVDDR